MLAEEEEGNIHLFASEDREGSGRRKKIRSLFERCDERLSDTLGTNMRGNQGADSQHHVSQIISARSHRQIIPDMGLRHGRSIDRVARPLRLRDRGEKAAIGDSSCGR